MKKLVVAGAAAAVLLASGCVTTSQSKSEYQSEIANLEAENAALKQTLNTEAYVDRRLNAFTEQLKMLFDLWSAERRPHSVSGKH